MGNDQGYKSAFCTKCNKRNIGHDKNGNLVCLEKNCGSTEVEEFWVNEESTIPVDRKMLRGKGFDKLRGKKLDQNNK